MAVRWDAVIQDDSFWSQPARAGSAAAVADSHIPVEVQVWLFGSLADAVDERPVILRFDGAFCAGDVVAELGRRYGPELIAKITTPDGAKARNCRVFANGEPVGDSMTPIRTGTSPVRVELIVLNPLEGG